jgi:hypothetical protein
MSYARREPELRQQARFSMASMQPSVQVLQENSVTTPQLQNIHIDCNICFAVLKHMEIMLTSC